MFVLILFSFKGHNEYNDYHKDTEFDCNIKLHVYLNCINMLTKHTHSRGFGTQKVAFDLSESKDV